MKPSAGRRYKTFDGEGLYVEVLPTGQKVWRIKWGWQGQPQSPFTLGRYPAISLKEARLKLADFKRALDAGIHPVRQKLFEQEADQNTFERVALEWLDKQKAAWDNKHWQTVKGRLERFAFPHIGAMPVRQITPTDMLRLLRLIEEQGKLSTTERVKGICSQAFRYGIAAGYCDSDPCRDLAGALIPYREKHRAAMTRPDDVALLMARIFTYQGSPIVKYALLWAAYTFCRPVEVSRASFLPKLTTRCRNGGCPPNG